MNADWGVNRFEAVVECGREAASFDAVFFDYVERFAPLDEDGPIIFNSLPEGDFERKTVVLSSAAAVVEFARLWRRFHCCGERQTRAPGHALSLDEDLAGPVRTSSDFGADHP